MSRNPFKSALKSVLLEAALGQTLGFALLVAFYFAAGSVIDELPGSSWAEPLSTLLGGTFVLLAAAHAAVAAYCAYRVYREPRAARRAMMREAAFVLLAPPLLWALLIRDLGPRLMPVLSWRVADLLAPLARPAPDAAEHAHPR